MKKRRMKKIVAVICSAALLTGLLGSMPASAAPADWANYQNVVLVENSNGLVLGYDSRTGVTILTDAASGYKFKDLNKNGTLDVYEDWRKDIETRTADLLSKMPLTQKLALMSHGSSDVSSGFRMNVVRSIGKGSQADGTNGNALQRQAEATAFGIPYAFSSDPVHTGFQDTGTVNPWEPEPLLPVTNISLWPNTLGLANTFSPEMHYKFGRTIAKEYRNSQIFQQLGPMFDQITHPTWSRSAAAITEDYDLLVDLAQAEVAGMQTTEGPAIPDYGLPAGWGKESISAMAKHVLGTASGEFGYEGHTQIGGWLVFPGNGYQKYIETITKAAGIGVYPAHSPKVVNAAMTAYGIDTGYDGLGRHNGLLGDKRYSLVGGGYSNWIMNEWLRGEKKWDGMIVSDWGIYSGTGASNHGMQTSHGITSDAQRYLVSFLSGMSQTGGAANISTLTAAYNLGVSGDTTLGIPAYGADYMNKIVDARAGNVIKTMMKVGLFENPYTDPDKANAENGSAELNEIAFQAHHESIVMLKNSNNILPLPTKSGKKVYAVGSNSGSGLGTGYGSIAHDFRGITDMAKRYFGAENMVANPADADLAIVMISGPNNGNGTAGVPQTAQWGHYTKTVGREVSIGGYWYHKDGTRVRAYEIPNPAIGDYKQNMSNIGFTTIPTNPNPNSPTNAEEMVRILKILTDTKAAMGDKPVVLLLDYRNGVCPAEVEPLADAILAGCWGSQEAYMNLATGVYEPTGMLAVTFPRSMASIELSAEDVPDTTPYVDADGNVYQFGFGLNYSGRIVDERTEKYLGLSEIKSFTAKKGDTITVPIELLKYKYGPAAVNANVYYDKSLLKLNSIAGAKGFQLVSSGDRFNIATTNGKGVLDGAVAGYAVFEVIATPDDDAKLAVTFAMNTAAIDADLNPTMARFADVNVTVLSDDPLAGDITLDGKVDLADVVLLMQYISGNVKLNNKQMRAADVSKDGAVNVGDSIIIMQMCL